MRNRKVFTPMRIKYKSLLPDPIPLQIAFVSNVCYATHREGFEEDEIPISLKLTEIPNLRFEMSKFPARSRLDVLTHHYKGNLQAVIHLMEMWSRQSTIQRRNEPCEVVSKPGQVFFQLLTRKAMN